MLTPNDISSKKFEKSAFGYKPEDVDNFLSEVLNSYSAVYAEKEAAERKAREEAEKKANKDKKDKKDGDKRFHNINPFCSCR